ncbi:F0F1 ATP synthase subunit A [Saccharibacillus sp. CPCC 101409]|uniref:F0F1 ATP synthase subunit A n=1 Tax=Saccharibacillus sp. CPCC 101409 TaxID=3058041 RepID=UPI0026718337|nr:F0F1 ATP synthase subunit A [Saccharibacillus sp. CPCC 101409]MDO3412118.1 F0F1 ATP synthase subunit A [Saccharibacillus sp. CPCC 101409]
MHESLIIELLGMRVDLSVVLMLIVSCAVVFLIAKLATRKLSVENPGKMQNFMEWVIEFVQNQIAGTMDMKKGRPFVTLAVTLIMFIFVSNMLGLPFGIVIHPHSVAEATVFGHPILPAVEAFNAAAAAGTEAHVEVAIWKSPTADVTVAMTLAAIVFILVHFLGITKNTKAYFKHYFEPYPVFFPINLIEQFSSLLTHGMRLYGNIFAGEVLISVILKLAAVNVVGLIASIPLMMVWQGFSIFVGAIQAFVFTILALVYISQKIDTHEEH